MKPDEIRKQPDLLVDAINKQINSAEVKSKEDGFIILDSGLTAANLWAQSEIAAQLAEINEKKPTLRDQFAIAAMQGVFSGNSDEFWVDASLNVMRTTTQAYKWADGSANGLEARWLL